MTQKEHLLACLAEEAGELAHAVGKALRFGLEDGHPDRDSNNMDDIAVELAHVQAVAEMLDVKHRTRSAGSLMDAKIQTTQKYLEYAQERGTVEPSKDGVR